MDRHGRGLHGLHRAGLAWENGYIESFNPRLRDEFLEQET